MTDIILECPHCKGTIVVNEKQINCAIFRHAILKSNGKQVDPHLKKDKCDELVSANKVIGCCKPFRMIKESVIEEPQSASSSTDPSPPAPAPKFQWKAIECDYI